MDTHNETNHNYNLNMAVFIIAIGVMNFDYGSMRLHELNAQNGDLFTSGTETNNDEELPATEKGKVIVKYCNSSTTGVKLFKVGDKVCQMHQHTLIPDKKAIITKVREINNEFTELIFDEEIEFTKDCVIENLTAYPEVLLKNCKIRNINALSAQTFESLLRQVR